MKKASLAADAAKRVETISAGVHAMEVPAAEARGEIMRTRSTRPMPKFVGAALLKAMEA